MKKLILVLVLILIIPNSIALLQINEIMYNPGGEDNNKEYIEIITDLNLENFTLQDLKEQDTLRLVKKVDSNYALIVEEGFNYENINANIYTTGANIGNNLNNEGDIIIIKNSEEIFDVLHYYSYWGGDNNGNSLCLINFWRECPSTPGEENKASLEKEYNLKINEFLPDPIGNDDAIMPQGEWIELLNLGNRVNLEGFYFRDLSGKTLYISNTNTDNLEIEEYLVIYTNGFSGLLNNEGIEKIQLFDIYGNLIDEVSYGSTKEGLSWSKIENKWVETIPTPEKENFLDEEEKDSKIKIENIYLGNDKTAKFGDTIRVRLDIYKGDTNKKQISAYLTKDNEKISQVTDANIEDKFKETTLTIPIQILPNCNNRYSDGEYTLVVEGLEEKEEKEIPIYGIKDGMCEKIKEVSKETSLKSTSETNINEQKVQENSLVYESTNKKSSRLAVYFFCLVLVFVIIQLIIENGKNKS